MMDDYCPRLWISGDAAEKLAKGKTDGKKVKVQAEIEIHQVQFAKDEPTRIQVEFHTVDGVNLEGASEYGPVALSPAGGPTKIHRSVHKAMSKVMGVGSHKSKEKESY